MGLRGSKLISVHLHSIPGPKYSDLHSIRQYFQFHPGFFPAGARSEICATNLSSEFVNTYILHRHNIDNCILTRS